MGSVLLGSTIYHRQWCVDFVASVLSFRIMNFRTRFFFIFPSINMKRMFFCTIPALMLAVLVFAISDAHAQSDIDVKGYLRKLDNYRYSKVSVFEVDTATALRFREVLTPVPPKTTALLEAERNCPMTDDIRRRIEKGLPIFGLSLRKNAADCETVRNYYKANADLIRIGRVFVITTKVEKGIEPLIIGAVSVLKGSQSQEADRIWLLNSLNSSIPNGTLDADDLRKLTTTELSGNDKGSLAKPLGASMFEHIKSSIKQNQFANVTEKLRPRFSPEITYLMQKGVFVVNPRGLLPPSPATTTMSPEVAALATIDDAALPYLKRWQILDPRVIVLIRGFFRSQGMLATDSVVIVTGEPKKNGKYDLFEVRCGNKLATKKHIDNNMLMGVNDLIGHPVDSYGKDTYLYDELNPGFYALPLPLNINELLAENKASPAPSKPATKLKK